MMSSNKKFDALVKRFFDFHIRNDPILATEMGIHKYDGLLPDESKEFYLKETAQLKKFLKDFSSFKEKDLTFDRNIDRLLVIHILKMSIWDQDKLKSYEQEVDAVDYLGSSLFTLFSRDFAPFEKRILSISSRLEKAPTMLEQFRKRTRDPVRIWTEIAIESCDEFPDFLDEILAAARKRIKKKNVLNRLERAVAGCKSAIGDYKKFLESLLPKCTDKFYLGDRLFAELIELRELGMTPEEILEFGKLSLRKEQEKMSSIARRINPNLTTKQVLDLVMSDHHNDFGKVLNEYRDRCAEQRRFVKKINYATIPKNEKLIVKETPSFLRHTIPFAAYFPPAKFDKTQLGIYIVTPPSSPEEFKKYSHADIANVCIHEAYPGHHLQLSASNSNKSPIRALVDATEFVEGWAFYCEDTLVEMGYPTSDEMDLIKCYGMVWRAARIVVDVLLSTGKMGFDEAVEFMVKEVGMIRSGALAEVKRYTQSPSYQLSYYLGKHQIIELRKEMERLLGDMFDIKKFHDALIYSGSLPIKYHRMVLKQKLS